MEVVHELVGETAPRKGSADAPCYDGGMVAVATYHVVGTIDGGILEVLAVGKAVGCGLNATAVPDHEAYLVAAVIERLAGRTTEK